MATVAQNTHDDDAFAVRPDGHILMQGASERVLHADPEATEDLVDASQGLVEGVGATIENLGRVAQLIHAVCDSHIDLLVIVPVRAALGAGVSPGVMPGRAHRRSAGWDWQALCIEKNEVTTTLPPRTKVLSPGRFWCTIFEHRSKYTHHYRAAPLVVDR